MATPGTPPPQRDAAPAAAKRRVAYPEALRPYLTGRGFAAATRDDVMRLRITHFGGFVRDHLKLPPNLVPVERPTPAFRCAVCGVFAPPRPAGTLLGADAAETWVRYAPDAVSCEVPTNEFGRHACHRECLAAVALDDLTAGGELKAWTAEQFALRPVALDTTQLRRRCRVVRGENEIIVFELRPPAHGRCPFCRAAYPEGLAATRAALAEAFGDDDDDDVARAAALVSPLTHVETTSSAQAATPHAPPPPRFNPSDAAVLAPLAKPYALLDFGGDRAVDLRYKTPDGELVPLARDAEDFGIVPLEVVSAVGLPRLLLSRFAGVRPGDSPKIGAFHVDERTQYVPRAGLRDDASCESLLLAQSDGAASFGEAHPVAARVLATALGCRLVDNGRAVAWPGSIAMRRDLKEAEAVAAALGPLVDAFVATTSRGERVTLLRLVGDIEGALPEDSAESSDFLFFDETPALRDVPVLAADAVGSRRAFAELCYHARRHVALRVDCRVPCGRYVVVGRFADGLTNCRAAQACVAYDDDGRRRALREQLERAYRSVPRPSRAAVSQRDSTLNLTLTLTLGRPSSTRSRDASSSSRPTPTPSSKLRSSTRVTLKATTRACRRARRRGGVACARPRRHRSRAPPEYSIL